MCSDNSRQNRAELEFLRPDWQVSTSVQAATTLRFGGVSEGSFASLNLGLHVGDDADHVRINRSRLVHALNLPSEPHWLNQVHGTDVQRITQVATRLISADAAWTDQPDTVLAVLTADCLPVVIANAAGTEVAVAHAGWRGLVAGVLEQTVRTFQDAAGLHAWLGPAIGPDRFEVGPEVRQAFVSRDAEYAVAFKAVAESDRYLADLYKLATRELNRAAAVQVSGGGCCTLTEAARFHSYRRDGAGSGRLATLIWRTSAHKK